MMSLNCIKMAHRIPEDMLINEISKMWNVPVPSNPQEIVEMLEVIGHNLGLRLNIPVDRLFIELESEQEIIRIGEMTELEKMNKKIKEWNEYVKKDNERKSREQDINQL